MTFRKVLAAACILLLSVAAGVGLAEIYLRLTAEHWSLEKLKNRSMRYEASLYARHYCPAKHSQYFGKKT